MAALPFCHARRKAPRPPERPWFYPSDPQTLGQRLKQRRIDRGLTQEHLAETLGTTPTSVSEWERDACLPLPRHWGGLAEVLGMDVVPGGPDFPGRLKAARLRLGLTLETLAERAGVDPRTLRYWEAGAYAPLRRTLARIEAVLGPI